MTARFFTAICQNTYLMTSGEDTEACVWCSRIYLITKRAALEANLPKLSKIRDDTLSQNLFANIVTNKDHKLAPLLQKKQSIRTISGQLERSKTK